MASSCSTPEPRDAPPEDQQVTWWAERCGIPSIAAYLRKLQVPAGRPSAGYLLGGLAVLFFAMQTITGVMLLVYYRPDPATAHASVTHIVRDVPFGWLVRSLHVTGSHAMIAVVLAHLAFTLLTRAYQRPRELTWLTGLALATLTLGLGWTGTVLAWDVRGAFAAEVGLHLVASVPLVGSTAAHALRAGSIVGADTLQRFLVLHQAVLPGCVVLLVLVHLGLVHVHGLAHATPAHRSSTPAPTAAFLPGFALRTAVAWTLSVNVLVALAVLAPAEVGAAADPLQPTPAGVLPPWYFTPIYQVLRLLPDKSLAPGAIATFATLALAVAVAAVPWWAPRARSPKAPAVFACVVAIAAVGLALAARLQR